MGTGLTDSFVFVVVIQTKEDPEPELGHKFTSLEIRGLHSHYTL